MLLITHMHNLLAYLAEGQMSVWDGTASLIPPLTLSSNNLFSKTTG